MPLCSEGYIPVGKGDEGEEVYLLDYIGRTKNRVYQKVKRGSSANRSSKSGKQLVRELGWDLRKVELKELSTKHG